MKNAELYPVVGVFTDSMFYRHNHRLVGERTVKVDNKEVRTAAVALDRPMKLFGVSSTGETDFTAMVTHITIEQIYTLVESTGNVVDLDLDPTPLALKSDERTQCLTLDTGDGILEMHIDLDASAMTFHSENKNFVGVVFSLTRG
jgi:hypothetical protein